MTRGLKFSFAVRAAASNSGRSLSPHLIRINAVSRDIGEPGGKWANCSAKDAVSRTPFSTVDGMVLRVTARFLRDSDASNHTSVSTAADRNRSHNPRAKAFSRGKKPPGQKKTLTPPACDKRVRPFDT